MREDNGDAIVCADLSVGMGPNERVVDGVTFSVPKGGTLCVSGGSGSGKSSLASVLAGDSKDGLGVVGGQATVCGISVARKGRARRALTVHAGHLPQGAGANLPGRLTVSEVIGEPITMRDRKVNASALSVRVASLLDEMHLPLGAAARFPYELSAGMRQRVAFARALVLDPKVFIADEPLANIDLEVRHVVFDAIVRRRREWAMAALIVSNDSDFARELGADRLLLRHGHVVAQASSGEVLRTPGADVDDSLIAS